MKANPVIYLLAMLSLLIVSALVLPARVTSNKGSNESVSGKRKQVGRSRTLSRSSAGQRSSGNAAGESSETAAQIAQLVLPNLKRSAVGVASAISPGSTESALVAPQEPSVATPQVVPIVGPVSQDRNLRDLPYIP